MTNEKEQFDILIRHAIANKTDVPPENPNEFDIYCDNHYNIHMFLKGEWTNVGLNVTLMAN